MPVEFSVGAIIFRKEGDKIFYLLLHYPAIARAKKDYWDLPKGHIKKGEKELDAVKREVEEETGLKDIKFIEGFKGEIEYFFKFQGQTIFKTVIFYLAETNTKEIKISGEHIGFKWLTFKEAKEQLTFKNAKEIIQKADNFISGKGI